MWLQMPFLDFHLLIKEMPKDSPYTIQEGYLLKKNKLSFLKWSLRELLVQEPYNGALAGHLSLNKTINIQKEHFYWPK